MFAFFDGSSAYACAIIFAPIAPRRNPAIFFRSDFLISDDVPNVAAISPDDFSCFSSACYNIAWHRIDQWSVLNIVSHIDFP